MNSIYQILSSANFEKNDDRVWQPQDIGEFAYNDGDEAELYILNTIRSTVDKSCGSIELAQKMIDWPSTYHLTPRRANLLRPFQNEFKDKRVLEIGCGCGAITRFLGESGAEVVSVEGSLRRATIARARCEDLPNVEIICSSSEKLPDLGKFDYVLLIGVLEYARVFLGENGQTLLLDSCFSRLSEDGKIFVAIENKLGIKYFGGAAEDHVGQPMFGINNSYNDNGVMTFGREELKKLLYSCGFRYIEEYLPLPDYKLPTDIVTPLGWKKYSSKLSQLAIESAHKDAQGITEPVFSIEQALKSIWENNLAADLSNSFLFIASQHESHQNSNILIHHYSDGRVPELNKKLIIVEGDNGNLDVISSCDHNGDVVSSNHDLFNHEVQETAVFFSGRSLWLDLLDIVNKPGWSKSSIQNWLASWLDYIVKEENISGELDKNTLLPGKYNDAMPFNILVGKGNVEFIDLEWVANNDIPLGYVVFRGVLHSLLRITSVAKSPDGDNLNLVSLLVEILLEAGLNINNEDIELYWERECLFMQHTQIGNVNNIREGLQHAVLKTRVPMREYSDRNLELSHRLNEWERSFQEKIDKESVKLKENQHEKMLSLNAVNIELTEKNNQLIEDNAIKSQEIEVLTEENKRLNDEVSLYNGSNSQEKDKLIRYENENRDKDNKIKELNDEINRLLTTNSWKITKPLRFTMRIFRGQHQEALAPLKKSVREELKKLYYKAPAQYRNSLLKMAFRLRPNWFFHHPEFQRKNGFIINSVNGTQHLLVDFNTLPSSIYDYPKSVALHCHIYYYDLISEFSHHISQVPFEIDVFVSVTSNEAQEICRDELSKLSNIKNLYVEIVPNRGRDIGPMFAHFGSRLKTYDYVGHIQSKKSLYNEGATLGWREYLFNALLGSKENIERIFYQFSNNPKLGIIYPQAFVQVPYMAFTWLANKADGQRLCSMMNIEMPEAYFNFPAGSMFWARTDALRPLFDLNLGWEDFPEELAQNDGTVAHAIERLLGVVPEALNYGSLIIKDHQFPSWTTFRFDQQYFVRSFETYRHLINDVDTHLVAFDIFDTILTRPLLNPDHTKIIVSGYLNAEECKLFNQYRAEAESVARYSAGKDVGIFEIYKSFSKLTGIPYERCREIAELESDVELSSVGLRHDAKELMRMAKECGKKVILISDMFLNRDTIISMLQKNGAMDWDELYLSSEVGFRKDTGKLYEFVFEKEGVSGNHVLMIGDNERSDFQLPTDFFQVKCLHLLRANDMAKSLNDYLPLISDRAISCNLDNELTLGLIIQKNLNKIAAIESDDLRLYSEKPYALGYNLIGPLLVSFSEWLCKQSMEKGIEHLYFLAREGKIIKEVFDKWHETYSNKITNSSYLQVSRRSVNVPRIKSFDDVKEIASIDFYPNQLSTFLFERFGLELDEDKWKDLYEKNLWSEGKCVEIQNKDISIIEKVLSFLLPEIIASAAVENNAMLQYLNSTGIVKEPNVAVVDVGYSGTIQKSLIALLDKPIHGFYMATSNSVRNGMHNDALTEGCFVSNSLENFSDSRIYTKSFALEQLLSANDAQIAKYVQATDGILEKVFKPLREQEIATQKTRNHLQQGIMDYLHDAVEVKKNFNPKFSPSLLVANKLYSGFVDSGKDKQNTVLKQLVLDDDYCGRGLVS